MSREAEIVERETAIVAISRKIVDLSPVAKSFVIAQSEKLTKNTKVMLICVTVQFCAASEEKRQLLSRLSA